MHIAKSLERKRRPGPERVRPQYRSPNSSRFILIADYLATGCEKRRRKTGGETKVSKAKALIANSGLQESPKRIEQGRIPDTRFRSRHVMLCSCRLVSRKKPVMDVRMVKQYASGAASGARISPPIVQA